MENSTEPETEQSATAAQPELMGAVERLEGRTLVGWVSDGTSESRQLDVFIDDEFYCTVRADKPRKDVLAAGFAITNSGFEVTFPIEKLEGHKLLKVYDHRSGREVAGSPREILLPSDDHAAVATASSAPADHHLVRVVPSPARVETSVAQTALPPQAIEPASATDAAWPGDVDQDAATPADAPLHASDGQTSQDDDGEARTERVLHGHIEGFDGKTLSGWVTDGGKDYTTVQIFLNGEFYAEIEGDLPRHDVVAAGFTSLNSGFLFDIPAIYLSETCIVRVVDAISGKDIVGSPISIDPPAVTAPDDTADIGMLANIVDGLTERTTNVATLQANAALIMNWLQHTVDRAAALKNLEAFRFEKLNNVVAENGGLSGTLGHFYGLVQALYAQITLPRSPRPKVSIVIPVHNKFELTYNCISSIHDALTKVSFEIIIVDDSSSDETLLSSLMFQGGCYTVRTSKNEGFIGACNLGASRASGEYLLFLNNDTLVNDGWLDALTETMDSDPGIGIAGSRLLFADGVLQEAGGIIWRDGSAWNWGRGQDKSHPTYSFMRENSMASTSTTRRPITRIRISASGCGRPATGSWCSPSRRSFTSRGNPTARARLRG
jgi:hypothetical protein